MSLSVGLIGCGHIAKFHARNICDAISRHGVNVTYDAVCDLDVERARQFADIGGCSLITSEAEAVIEACDIVYICTETEQHLHLAVQALDAGCHVFCEKPLAKNLTDASTMTAAAIAAGVTHQAGLVLRFSPVYTVLADLMQADWGPVLSMHMRDDQSFPIGEHYGSNWRADPHRAGSGALLEHSIHDVDLFAGLFGVIRSVVCDTRETSGHQGIEDVANVRFTHSGGHTSTLASIWHNVQTRQSGRSLEIFFERARFTTEHDYFGTITMEIEDQQAVTLSGDEVLERFVQLQSLHPEEEDLRSIAGIGDRRFLEAALNRVQAVPSFTDALSAHGIVDACYRSAATGTQVTL